MARSVAGRVLFVILLAVLGAMVVGQFLGQPILLGYVETGSMEPTIGAGDGFVVMPPAVVGPASVGDVVVFDAEQLNGGGLVTHRIVGRTGGGFVTRGDANLVTDQDGGEPPVTRPQIVGKAVEIGGGPVVVPGLGLAVTGAQSALSDVQRGIATALGTRALLGTRGFSILLGAVGLLAYAAIAAAERTSGRLSRTRRRARHSVDASAVIAALVTVVVLVATASMVVPAGPHQFDVVSSVSDAPGSSVVERGGSETVRFRVPSNGLVPVVVFVEPSSEGVTVDPGELYVPALEERTVAVTLQAPEQTGYYRRFIVEHRYIAILPRGILRSLYGLHPWLPIVVIDALLAAGLAGLGVSLLGVTPVRLRSSSVPLTVRIRRWL
jgi:signal peptidase